MVNQLSKEQIVSLNKIVVYEFKKNQKPKRYSLDEARSHKEKLQIEVFSDKEYQSILNDLVDNWKFYKELGNE